MNIRSITYFLDPGQPLDEAAMRKAGAFIAVARPAFEAAGYEVQTTRMATVPFPSLFADAPRAQVSGWAQALESAARSLGFDFLSIGPALPDRLGSYEIIPDVLGETESVFASGVMASRETGISLEAVGACARVIRRAARLDPNGFGNLYFAALANVPPGSPFFPAAYHGGGPPTFALATESADLAVDACASADNLEAARAGLVARVEAHGQALATTGAGLAERFGLLFGGIDFSLAPFPEDARSLATAMERLGVPGVGLGGSLAAAAFLADALDRARFQRAGFSGLFLPVLEDSTLAMRASDGSLGIYDLLLYTAVCGTGLDTIPLPGDTTAEQLAPVLLDLAALSQRLDKPLTARLMPIPGKAPGEATEFTFPYFANSHVLALPAEPLRPPLAGVETLRLAPHRGSSLQAPDGSRS